MAATASTTTASLPPVYRHGNSDILPTWLQRGAAATQQPWTATRCHRQLRSLLTHLTALRREKARDALKRRDDASRQLPSPSKRSSQEYEPVSRKRVRYTYSLKGTGRRRQGRPSEASSTPGDITEHNKGTKVVSLKPQGMRSFQPGEIVVATPVLSRARKHRQAWSLPSSPITRCTSAEGPEFGGGAPVPRDPEASRPRPGNPSFKYCGYFQDPLRRGAGGNVKSPMDEEWATLTKEAPYEYRQLYESIFRAVDALLRATTCVLDTAGKSNSLLAMCLRKVPHYVTLCEDAEREDAEKEGTVRLPSSSVSLGIYSDLESLGNESGGWKHLRTVVREHGISILKAACAEGLLHDAFIRLLIRLCAHLKAYDEAEGLMTALFDNHITTLPKGQCLYRNPDEADGDLSDSTGPMASLNMLLRYIDETGRTSTPLRLITDLLGNGHLPSAWLSTQEFGSLWHRVVRLLSSRGAPVCDEGIVLDFSATATTQLVRPQLADDIRDSHPGTGRRSISELRNSTSGSLSSSSSYHTLVSILGGIYAIGILQREAALEDGDAGAAQEPAVLKRLSVIIEHSLSATSQRTASRKGRPKQGNTTHCFPRRYLLVLAFCLSQSKPTRDMGNPSRGIEHRDTNTFGKTVLRQLTEIAASAQKVQLYDATIAFVTSVAESCGRGSESVVPSMPAARPYLLELCTQAAGHLCSVLDYDSKDSLANRLQADAALLLASRSNDLRDLAFAECLGKGSIQIHEHRLSPEPRARQSAISTPSGEVVSLCSKPYAAPMAALFEGYKWEEGISEWVISTPASVSPRPERSQRFGRQRGMGVGERVLGEATQEQKKQLRRLSSNFVRRSLPTSFPTPSPTSGYTSDTDGRSDNDGNISYTTPPPRTPSRKAAAITTKTMAMPSSKTMPEESPQSSDSDWHPTRSRRMRPNRPMRPSKATLRTTQSLLNLVSDNDVGDGFYGGGKPVGATRVPLFDLASNARRSTGPGHTQQKQDATDGVSQQITNDIVASSDDELCM